MPAHAWLRALIRGVCGRFTWITLATVAMGNCAYAEEDPYLSAISEEAKKVEAESQSTTSITGQPAAPTEDGLSLVAFEEDLKARYKGSYTFYQKLPRRTKEEVFLEYRNGASIDEIRKMIMDRFLHQ
jgi:hypothetical protein